MTHLNLFASFGLPAIACVALWLLNGKKRSGWLLNAGAQILWLTFGLISGQYGFAFSAPVFFLINLRGWIKWKPSQPGHCDSCHQKLPETKEATS
jgi:hypothetical protein